MYSRTAIANLCFAALDCPAVEDIDADESAAALAARRVWDVTRDNALALHPWDFAKTRWPDRTAVTNPAPDDWDYAYAIPADCLLVTSVGTREGVRFEVEGDKVLCDTAAPVVLRGIARVVDTGKYPVWFVRYFAHALAAAIVKSVAGSEAVRERVNLEAAKALADARFKNGRQGTVPGRRSTFLQSRLAAGSPYTGRV